MAKSYVPQLVRRLNAVCVYITKHQGTMNAYLSPTQQAALQSIVSACVVFSAVQTHEQP